MKKNLKLVYKPGWGIPLFSLLFMLTLSAITNAQTITGTVTNKEGEKLAGVTIMVKGVNKATSSDLAGRFSIDAGGKSILTFSSVGYVNQAWMALTGHRVDAAYLEGRCRDEPGQPPCLPRSQLAAPALLLARF